MRTTILENQHLFPPVGEMSLEKYAEVCREKVLAIRIKAERIAPCYEKHREALEQLFGSEEPVSKFFNNLAAQAQIRILLLFAYYTEHNLNEQDLAALKAAQEKEEKENWELTNKAIRMAQVIDELKKNNFIIMDERQSLSLNFDCSFIQEIEIQSADSTEMEKILDDVQEKLPNLKIDTTIGEDKVKLEQRKKDFSFFVELIKIMQGMRQNYIESVRL